VNRKQLGGRGEYGPAENNQEERGDATSGRGENERNPTAKGRFEEARYRKKC